MFVTLKYAGKCIKLIPYNTKTEKDILLINELNDVFNIDDILELLQPNISCDGTQLTRSEKIAILFKLRSVSIGEEISVRWKCQSCTIQNEDVINISDIIDDNNTGKYNFCDEEVSEENLHKFIDVDVNEMSLKDLNVLLKDIEEHSTHFNFIKKISCQKCGDIQEFDISDDEYVCESLSEDTLMSWYQSVSDLVFYGHYTKSDVDDMLPFERSMFIGILNKTKEDLVQ